jgi:hypothetical protein
MARFLHFGANNVEWRVECAKLVQLMFYTAILTPDPTIG